MMDLKEVIKKHEKRRFPPFPEDDEFSEWLEELIETDAYYMGLALTKESGGKVVVNEKHLRKLKSELIKFSHVEDKLIYIMSAEYIHPLEKLIAEMKK